MTWGDHITKQYVDNAVSAAGWKKQIVTVLPNVDEAADNVIYLVKDDLASTKTGNVYNEYILVTDPEGVKSLESIGMVSTGVEMTFLDLDQFSGSLGTVSDDVYNSVVSAYENKIVVGVIDGSIAPITIYKTTIGSSVVYNISLNSISNSYRRDVLEFANRFIILKEDKSFTVDYFNYDIYGYYIDFLKFMTIDPSVVTTLENLPKGRHNIIANVSAATSLSMSVSSSDAGREWQARVNNTTSYDITQPLPTTGWFQSMSGNSVTIPANSFIELSIWYINGRLVIRVGENA